MIRKRTAILMTALCATLAVTWFSWSKDAATTAKRMRGPAGAPIPEKDQILAKFADSLTDLQKIEAEVRERNRPLDEQRKKFIKAGWKFVKTPPPDKDLLALDPSLLGSREEELQHQIHSTSWSGEAADKLYEIALKTESDRTRYVALEALGRSGEPEGQERLMEFYGTTDREEDRSLIIGYLRPATVDDSVGRFLVDRVNDSGSEPEERRQAAFPLVVAAAMAGQEEVDRLIASVRPERQKEIESMLQLVAGRGN